MIVKCCLLTWQLTALDLAALASILVFVQFSLQPLHSAGSNKNKLCEQNFDSMDGALGRWMCVLMLPQLHTSCGEN